MKRALNEIREILSRDGMFNRWLSFEKALANAQAKLGIIPAEAAEKIAENASADKLAMERYDEIYQKTGHPMVSMLRLLEEAIGGEAGQYIHLGATTQDVIDTANVLAVRAAMDLAEEKLFSIISAACDLAEKYAKTPMMGRTHNVHAQPITFGYKAAIWASELARSVERIREARKRVQCIQLSGAVGSMVSFGNDGAKIQRLVAQELGLGVPDICWHTARDRFGEFASDMSLIGCALGKIAQEVYLAMGTEIGELSEFWGEGRVGSSTMPHKVNPTNTQHLMGKATRLRYLSAEMQELMLVDHERNMQHSIEEQKVLEEICLCVSEVLDRGEELLSTLIVNEDNMLLNLNRLGGLTQSEHIMLELGKKIGKQKAHHMVNQIAVDSFKKHLNFEEELKKDSFIAEVLGEQNIHELLNPFHYMGKCTEMALETAKSIREEMEIWISEKLL